MKPHRFVIAFILVTSTLALVAGLWFHRPTAEGAKPVAAPSGPAVGAATAALIAIQK